MTITAIWWIKELYSTRHDGYLVKELMGYPYNYSRRDSIKFWIRIYRNNID